MASFLQSLFDRGQLNKYQKKVKQINDLEEKIAGYTDQQFPEETQNLKSRYESGETLDVLLSEAFALVREAAKRTMTKRHYDVQLIGGMVLHDGLIGEMRTGEGKTLTGTLPVYLNALSGKGVHVVTVNDYLARRDATWMGEIYAFLGLSVGVINDQANSFIYDPDTKNMMKNEMKKDRLK